MKEQRRRLPRVVSPLETLDDRIVPSAIAPALTRHAAVVEHREAIQARVHHARHARMQLMHRVATGSATATVQPTVTSGSGGATSAVSPPSATTPAAVTTPSVTPTPTDIKSGPLAKAGQDLITIYEEFQQQGGGASFTSSKAGYIEIQGTNVGIDAYMSGGNFTTYVASLASLGMQIKSQDAAHGIVEGFLPISQLPSAAQNAQTLSLSPIYTKGLSTMAL